MCPGDVIVWTFYAVAIGRVVKHDFAIADVAVGVDLPKDGGIGPVFGCAKKVGVDEVGDGCGIEN